MSPLPHFLDSGESLNVIYFFFIYFFVSKKIEVDIFFGRVILGGARVSIPSVNIFWINAWMDQLYNWL